MSATSGAGFSGRLLLCALCAVVAVLLLASSDARALELVICGEGAGPEDCTAPTGVAADREVGLVYVADDGGEEVDVFEAGGAYLESWGVGAAVSAIAVDNDGASEAQGDVYLLDTACDCVRRFHPDGEEVLPAIGEGLFGFQAKLALGPGGVVYVADNIGEGNRRVQWFDHEGTPLGSCESTEAGKLEPEEGHGGNLRGVAVDSAGDFYLSNDFGAGVRKYDPACLPLGPVHSHEGTTSFNAGSLATDAADNLFVNDVTGLAFVNRTAIYAYTPAGALSRALYGKGTLLQRAISIAPLDGGPPGGTVEDEDDLAAAEGLGARRVVRFGFEPPGPVVHPEPQLTEAPEALIKNTSATLKTRVNPEGKASEYRFQYVEDAAYQEDIGEGGDGFGEASESEAAPLVPGGTPGFVPELFRLADASTLIGCPDPENPPQPECLKPETLYHFRALATNPDGEAEPGPEATFETKPPFVILDTWSSGVGIEVARLHARVNPLGIQTEGVFEYVEETACFADEAAAEGEGKSEEEVAEACFDQAQSTEPVDFGEGEGFQARASQLSDLDPGTAYVYRAVIENAFEQDDLGEELRFVTFAFPAAHGSCPNDDVRLGPAARLPDCRAWEMVSPVDKEGGEAVVNDPEETTRGDLFESAASVPPIGPGITYSSNRSFGEAAGAPLVSQYLARRGPAGWSSESVSPPREDATFNPFIALLGQYRIFSDDLGRGWLRTDTEPVLDEGAIPGYPNLYRRENATGRYEALCPVVPPNRTPIGYTPSVAELSADGEVAAIQANDKLADNAAETERLQVYACADRDDDGETSDEKPVTVSVLPGGEANPDFSGVGTFDGEGTHREASSHNAVSEDGSRIYWSDRGDVGDGPGKLYLRENSLGEGPECAGMGTPCTREVSEAVGESGADQPVFFWTAAPDGSSAIFSFSAGELAGNLYRFDAEADPEAENPTELLATGVSGLAGWSEDAQVLYAVSSDDLDGGGPATGGEPNLYRLEAGENPVLVASLPGGTLLGGVCNIGTFRPINRCARTTPDGSHLLFLSADPLTGYDSTDVSSPAPCGQEEGRCDVQAYLYDAADEELRCVSCNPTGSRPRGRGLPEGAFDPTWFAARIPGNWDSEHGARALSEDGRRLFFESFDRLSPADTNGNLDVYQWEEAGVGSCTEARPEFSPQAGGCIGLISSGQSPRHSWFADASTDGSDVFFRTAESLWPEDPGLIDLYDARVGGGYEPPPEPREVCEGDACAHPPSPPQAPTPASSAFAGPEGLPLARRSCRGPARRAKRLAKRTKRMRKAARRSSAPKRTRQLHRRAKGTAKRARRLSGKAKRCRKARRAQARRAGR